MTGTVRMYFHFRSPYSWIATERLALDPLPLELVPMSGIPKALRLDVSGNSARLNYIVEDIGRLTARLGLPVAFPEPFDTDWMRTNAAFWHAAREGKAFAFMVAAFQDRWRRGRDIGDSAVIADVARKIGADPDDLMAAMDDPVLQARAREAEGRAAEDGVIGVPFFVYKGQKFWGQDRLDDLREAMARDG